MTEETQEGAEETNEPGVVTINVQSKKTDRSITFTRNFGQDLEEASSLFGAEVVHSVFTAQAIIRAQGAARTVLDNGDNGPEQAISSGEAYTPGVVRRTGKAKKDPFDALAERVKSGDLTQEELMEELQKRIGGGE